MRERIVTCIVVGIALSTAVVSGGQSKAPAAWSVPRTFDGRPDLQGVWANNGMTPLERPKQWGGRATMTDAELADLKKRVQALQDGGDAFFGDELILAALEGKEKFKSADTQTGNYDQSWLSDRVFDNRTSLIIDPPDGRVPPQTAEGRARAARAPDRGNSVNASWLDRGNAERCITYGLPSASLPTLYNNNIQIVQAPGYAVIVHEMIHEARVVPLDGRSKLNEHVQGWIGDSRGRWEGDTLVVETTNFNGKNSYRGSTTGLHLTERYTRVDEGRLELRLTVSDPTTWEKPWTVLLPMRPTEGELIEYACHEANLSMFNLLEVARDAEKAAAASGKAPGAADPADDKQER
jgi:hypothetical protein